MTADEREHLLSTVVQTHAGLSEAVFTLRLTLPPNTPALNTAIKAERAGLRSQALASAARGEGR